jgi:hypothetical protein
LQQSSTSSPVLYNTTMATPSTEGGTTFPVVYVVLGGAALLSTVIFPISFIVALRYYRRRSRFLDQRLPHASGVVYGGYLQQEEPKLFDIHVKPGLELHEPRFEYILVSCRSSSCGGGSPADAYLANGSALSIQITCSYLCFVTRSQCPADASLITQSGQGG